MKVENYGQMLAEIQGKKLISYDTFGSCQGDWLASIDCGENIEIWKGYYGSCSGCDWIENEKNYETNEISEKKIKEFFKEDRPFCVIPKSVMKDLSIKTFEQILPASTRSDIYEFEPKEMFEAIKSSIK